MVKSFLKSHNLDPGIKGWYCVIYWFCMVLIMNFWTFRWLPWVCQHSGLDLSRTSGRRGRLRILCRPETGDRFLGAQLLWGIWECRCDDDHQRPALHFISDPQTITAIAYSDDCAGFKKGTFLVNDLTYAPVSNIWKHTRLPRIVNGWALSLATENMQQLWKESPLGIPELLSWGEVRYFDG